MKQCNHPTCGEVCRREKKPKKVYVLKRTPIKRSAKPIAKKAAPKKIADKRRSEISLYTKERKLYLAVNKQCLASLHGCTKVATDVHHKKGRENKLLLDKQYWLPVCRSCHDWITEHSKEAIEMGLSVSRHQKTT